MINFKRDLLKKIDNTQKSDPVITITINVKELKTELNAESNEEVFLQLSKKDDGFISAIFKSLLPVI